jgi:hypothetical protein
MSSTVFGILTGSRLAFILYKAVLKALNFGATSTNLSKVFSLFHIHLQTVFSNIRFMLPLFSTTFSLIALTHSCIALTLSLTGG